MFCRNCQTIIPDDSIFCENCGAPTGLSREQAEEASAVSDAKLVPEDAVEYEVSEDVPHVSSVPVDPVWWEPEEDETETSGAESSEEALPAVEDAEAQGSEDERPMEVEGLEASWQETAPPQTQRPEPVPELIDPWILRATEPPAQGEISSPGEPMDAAASSEHRDDAWSAEPMDAASHSQRPGVGAGADFGAEEAGADAEAEEARAVDRPINISLYDDGAEEDSVPSGFAEDTASEADASQHGAPLRQAAEGAAEMAAGAAEAAADAVQRAKPYLKKAGALLGDLGKNVRTGTGWAADAAKQQYQQRREQYEEQKKQRDEKREEERKHREEERRQQQQRQEEERLRQEEQRRIEEEARAQEEARRQEKLQLQREQRRRELEEELLQKPGFWYDGLEPDPGHVIAPAVKVGEAPRQEEAEEKRPKDKASDEVAPEVEISDQEKPQRPQPLPAEHIEDKLADTARFSWSGEDLEKAVEAADAAVAGASAQEELSAKAENPEAADRQDSRKPWEKPAGSENDAAEDRAEDNMDGGAEGEDSPYRIRDYKPYEPPQPKKFFTRGRVILILVILAIAMAIAGIAAAALHQAHERQLAEEAYQASVQQAAQLVKSEKYEDAEALYVDLMNQRPEDVRLYVQLAQMYIDQQRYVDAKALIERAEEYTGDTESFAQQKKDLKALTSKKWKKAYIKVLEEYEQDIRRYEEDVQASVAVCDVNGDMKPELFFFTREYYGYGKLHIFTTVDNKAKEVTYECKNRGTQYHDAFYDVSSDDSSYAIFNDKATGQFSIYANIIHGNDSWDTTNEYSLNLKGGCKRLGVYEGSIDTTYEEGEQDDTQYLQNEEPITYDKYIEEFKRVLTDGEQVILYNGSGGDQSVWTKINPDTVMCMPYDSLMVDLQAK